MNALQQVRALLRAELEAAQVEVVAADAQWAALEASEQFKAAADALGKAHGREAQARALLRAIETAISAGKVPGDTSEPET